MNDFIKEGVKVGDRLYSLTQGWGEVKMVGKGTYPIVIDFKLAPQTCIKANGKIFETDALQSVFWDEPFIQIPVRPKREVVKEIDVFVNYNSQYHNHTESFRDIYEAEINADSNCPHIAIPAKLIFTILE